MLTENLRKRHIIFGVMVLIAVFLFMAYQSEMMSHPSLLQFVRTEHRRSHGNGRNEPGMQVPDLLTPASALTSTSKHKVNSKDTAPYWPVFTNTSNGKPFKVDKWLVETEACNILNYNPRDSTLDNIIDDHQKPFECPSNAFSGPVNVTGGLVYIQNGIIRVNKTVKMLVLEHYGTNESDFRCTVEYMKRFSFEADDWINRTLNKPTEFKNETEVLEEFMKILCYINSTTVVYETYDFAVIRKKDVEVRCNSYQKLQQTKGTFCKDQLSVLLIGVDSLSRLTSMRHLTKTRAILDKMGAIEFLGYNKIGLNTFPNMFPFLTGKLYNDPDYSCWNSKTRLYDNCTFLWDMFAAAGYRTAFVENMQYFGLFHMNMNGFRRQPADYYGRIFFQGAQNLLQPANLVRPYKAGCLRNVLEDEVVFQWGVEFQKEFSSDLHFGYFWTSLFSHDNFNDVQQLDPFLSENLNSMHEDKTLNNTLLIVMGDHGAGFGELLSTDIGIFENKLPAMFLVFPKWFQEKYQVEMQNVRVNARNRMITNLDLHQTLKAIINCEVGGPLSLKPMDPQRHRAISLFLPISERRTCSDAGVNDIYCSCFKSEIEVSTLSDRSLFISNLVVEKLNNFTEPKRNMCEVLSLNKTEAVKATIRGDKQELSQKDDVIFEVTLSTIPGGGKFRTSVYYNGTNGQYKVNDEISRLNAYGNSSACIKDAPLILSMCLCTDRH